MSEVVVVTGAGSIGQAIARRVGAGKQVVLADLHQDNADRAADVMRSAGFAISPSTVDVSSRDSVLALVELATTQGDITGLTDGSHLEEDQDSYYSDDPEDHPEHPMSGDQEPQSQ